MILVLGGQEITETQNVSDIWREEWHD